MKLHFNALSLLLGAAIISPVANATTPLWFEVEVVLFERLGEKTKEKFIDTIKHFNIENSIKLQDEHLYPPLDLCPTLSQFERFSLSKQVQIESENSNDETLLTDDTQLTNNTPLVDIDKTTTENQESNTPEITVIQCQAPNDETLREAYNILQTRLTQSQVNTDNGLTDDVNVVQKSALDSLVQDATSDSASELPETFDPNVFVPYPERFSFNGIDYSSTPRVIINKVPTVIATVIEPSIATETPVQGSSTESNEVEKQQPILIHTPDRPYLLDKSRLEMTELVQKFRWQKTSRPLLHIGWRQPMVARNLAVPIHLFAGKDYSDEYDNEGNNKALLAAQKQAALLNETTLDNTVELDALQNEPQDDLQQVTEIPSTSIVEIINELNTSNPVVDTKPIWQLDGLLKIYLNRFLFIEPTFDLRKVEQVKVIPDIVTLDTDAKSLLDINEQAIEPVNNEPTYVSKLTSHPMSQHRRVRSTEVHYFDHPNMGMVIQIRRFKIPEDTPEK